MSTTLEQRPLSAQVAVDGERAARASLREQIARLERRLGALAFELGSAGRSLPLPDPAPASRVIFGPRLQTFGELERIRDQMISRVRRAEGALSHRVESELQAHDRLERMLADPAAHRFEVVERTDLGVPGCGAYQVRPRLGLLGMLFDWWCVKLSSGCP